MLGLGYCQISRFLHTLLSFASLVGSMSTPEGANTAKLESKAETQQIKVGRGYGYFTRGEASLLPCLISDENEGF